MTSQNEIRERITNQIVSALEGNDLPPWRKPWYSDPHAGFPCNVVNRRRYSGVNPMLLMIAALRHGFKSRYWATFRQWESLGGRVNRRPDNVPPGQWGTSIVFCKPVTKRGTGEDGEETEGRFFVLRNFTVFNLDQVSGPFDHLRVGQVPTSEHEVHDRYEHADAVIEASRADIRYGSDRACYHFNGDFIQMPHRNQFSLPEFYETDFHELTHWTEHPTRLNWDRSKPENTYAMGELVAELGGVYLAGELGLPTSQNLANHAAYLKHWLTGMKNDTRFIFKAASQASRAVDYLLSFSQQHESTSDVEDAVLA